MDLRFSSRREASTEWQMFAAADPNCQILRTGRVTHRESFALFTWEFVQHEALHHGQWSIYASLAGFDTPSNWRESWGL